MAKKERGTIKSSIFSDAVEVRGLNRETSVVKRTVEKEFDPANTIHICALTANVGEGPGAISHLSKNKKVKYTTIGLSDEGLLELFLAIGHYLKEINKQI